MRTMPGPGGLDFNWDDLKLGLVTTLAGLFLNCIVLVCVR